MRKDDYRINSLINTYANILRKILATETIKHKKGNIPWPIEVDLSKECKVT